MSANVPVVLNAGDSWSWTAEFDSNPAPAWAVTFYFQNAQHAMSVSCVGSGASHVASKTAAETAALNVGRYFWRAVAVDGLLVSTLEEGWTQIRPNPIGSTADMRSQARTLLDAIEATIYGRATDGQLEMSIGNRLIKRIPLPELMQVRDKLKAEVETEERGVKAGLSRQLRTRFTRG